MTRINKEKLANYLSNIWVLEVRESERGWGSDTWTELYDSYESAKERRDEINKDNPTDRVPEYYIVAGDPKLFCDYYRFNLNK